MKITFLALICSLCLLQASAQTPQVYLVSASRLIQLKQQYKTKDAATVAGIKKITTKADGLLNMRPGSLLDKAFTPPSGDMHDYMSLAPYFWPDPSKPDGKPYIRKDGQHNPEINKITDKKNMNELCGAVRTLGFAYYFTGDEKYAKKASALIDFWFLDPATKMNPNFLYAQAVLGVNDGRGIGILESRCFADVVDAIGCIKDSQSWADSQDKSFRAWLNTYLDWMLTSKNGKDEHNAKNNHGIWYDVQILSYGLFLNRKDFVNNYLQETTFKRFPVQFETDGRQPLELARTTGLGYSTFSLTAWFNAATIAENIGVDIWNYQTSDGRSIKKALDWLLPYAVGDKKWEYQQINPYNKDEFYYLAIQAAKHYKDDNYYKAAEKIQDPEKDREVNLLYGK
ncbi:alginate lyase family protein [Chitinophagaceae bacterium LWZ2-11]